jgi:hypothetical protein
MLTPPSWEPRFEKVRDLQPGTDFRGKEYREEVWLQFYEFHLRYKAHPGCVYYLIPWLRERFGWGDEETLWFAFLNGNTQNPIVSLMFHEKFPGPEHEDGVVEFWNENYQRFEWDTDRRYHKKNFEKSVRDYCAKVKAAGTQKEFWSDAAQRGFAGVWEKASGLYSFGRLSAFSYSEYLRIAGVPFDCDDLMLGDISGSSSHRTGLCLVAGMDPWVKFWSKDFDNKWPKDVLSWLTAYAADLLSEMKSRAAGKAWEHDVSYFTLESALCTYKSWHKPNRRYPNVYNDMMFNRIRRAERQWPDLDLSLWWEARAECLPEHLRLEACPGDPGLARLKQNHYLRTGQVVMMDVEYPHFSNDFNDGVRKGPGEDTLNLFGA